MKKIPEQFISVTFDSLSLRERFKRKEKIEKNEIFYEDYNTLHLPVYLTAVAEESDLTASVTKI